MGETIFSSPVSCFDFPFQAKLAEPFAAQGTQPLAFGLAEPDLLEIQWTEGRIVWRVIDAKASQDHPQRISRPLCRQSSRHVHIYFYTLCLNYIHFFMLIHSAIEACRCKLARPYRDIPDVPNEHFHFTDVQHWGRVLI
jgi:hypothetical protein